MSKLKVVVLFGGRSAEHEVSVLSARSVIAGLDKERYEVIPLAINRQGHWLYAQAQQALDNGFVGDGCSDVAIRPGFGKECFWVTGDKQADGHVLEADLVFPVLHGTYGEDGTVQGLLEMANIAYVGAGVVSSVVGMDKEVMKKIWMHAGLPVLPWLPLLRSELQSDLAGCVKRCLQEPGLPCFVKPANLGSSVGISRADTAEELAEALRLAARFDRKIVVEKAVERPHEIEIGVIGNDIPSVSVPGEIAVGGAFYDYQTKYWSGADPDMRIPASLPPQTYRAIADIATKAWQALDLNGLGRVDFLLDNQGHPWLNEVNTMPGFTNFSMFGRLWEASDVSYSHLLDLLIILALERFEDRMKNEVQP